MEPIRRAGRTPDMRRASRAIPGNRQKRDREAGTWVPDSGIALPARLEMAFGDDVAPEILPKRNRPLGSQRPRLWNGHLVIGAPVKHAAGKVLTNASPLLKKERDLRCLALLVDIVHPFSLHGTSFRP